MNKFIIEIKKFFSVPKNFVFMVLGPLFFTFLFGYVYSNDYLNSIPIAVLDLDDSAISRGIIEEFESNARYDLQYYVTDASTLEELISAKKVEAGLFIPPGFEGNIKGKEGATAAIIVDGTNIALGNNALATGTEILNTYNAGLTIKFLEGKDVPPRLAQNYAEFFKIRSRTLWDTKLSYKTYMLPGMILVLVQQLFLSIFVVNYIEERENPIEKAVVHILVGVFAYLSCFLAIKYSLNIPVKGQLMVAAGCVLIYLCSLTGIAMSIGAVTRDRLKATQFCMMMSLPTFITAGYVWPIFKMPDTVSVISKILWPLVYLVSPLRDYIIKGVFPTGFEMTFLGMIIFGVIWLFLGVKLSRKLMEA